MIDMYSKITKKEMENRRRIRAYSILAKGDTPKLLKSRTYQIPSQNNPDKKYTVTNYRLWECDCPDFKKRHLKCKHIQAVELWIKLKNRLDNKTVELENELVTQEIQCDKCGSYNIVKNGNRKTSDGIRQRYKCTECDHRFTWDIIKHRKVSGKMIALSMDLYFKGLSLRKISDTIYQFYEIKIHHETIRRWITTFMGKMNEYVSNLKIEHSDIWVVDEQKVKTKKDQWVWVWSILDKESRFLIANNVTKGRSLSETRKIFEKAKENTKDKPFFVVTDGLPTYPSAFNKELYDHHQSCEHIHNAGIGKNENNNVIERYHGTYRERDKVMRSLQSKKTSADMLDYWRLYYNFMRTHQNLNGKTPSEQIGIMDEEKNKWFTLIRNVIQYENLKQKC